jgi:hypothetical protein
MCAFILDPPSRHNNIEEESACIKPEVATTVITISHEEGKK